MKKFHYYKKDDQLEFEEAIKLAKRFYVLSDLENHFNTEFLDDAIDLIDFVYCYAAMRFNQTIEKAIKKKKGDGVFFKCLCEYFDLSEKSKTNLSVITNEIKNGKNYFKIISIPYLEKWHDLKEMKKFFKDLFDFDFDKDKRWIEIEKDLTK